MDSEAPPRRTTRQKLIVTGGAGFVGSHLADRLLAEGHAVLVVDDLSTGVAEQVPEAAHLERLDISQDDLEPVFRSWRPWVVYHLAAQASVPRSIEDPLRDLAVNVIGTHRVALAARAAGARRLVFVSSGGAIYGETERAATELSPPAPASYYGIHKLAAEGHVELAGLPYAIARPSNIYGPRQGAGLEGAVVASFLDQAVRTGALRIHGDGQQTRDFVHVRDVVDALWTLGRDDVPAGRWNVASGRSVTIGDLADVVERALGRRLERAYASRRPGDVTASRISSSRLKALGWRPATTLAAGVGELARAAFTASETGIPQP